MEPMTRDDVMRETVKHVRRVAELMLDAVTALQRRAIHHDDSKFSPEEFDSFAEVTPLLRGVTYGSEEYKYNLAKIKPAIAHHNAANSHHPEHHADGIHGMDLIDLIEMLADWRAATERHNDGNLSASIVKNAERFGYDVRFGQLLERTARNLGWIRDGYRENA